MKMKNFYVREWEKTLRIFSVVITRWIFESTLTGNIPVAPPSGNKWLRMPIRCRLIFWQPDRARSTLHIHYWKHTWELSFAGLTTQLLIIFEFQICCSNNSDSIYFNDSNDDRYLSIQWLRMPKDLILIYIILIIVLLIIDCCSRLHIAWSKDRKCKLIKV